MIDEIARDQALHRWGSPNSSWTGRRRGRVDRRGALRSSEQRSQSSAGASLAEIAEVLGTTPGSLTRVVTATAVATKSARTFDLYQFGRLVNANLPLVFAKIIKNFQNDRFSADVVDGNGDSREKSDITLLSIAASYMWPRRATISERDLELSKEIVNDHRNIVDYLYSQSDILLGTKITPKKQFHIDEQALDARLRELDEFAVSNPGQPISQFVRQILSDLSQEARAETASISERLPTEAPANWRSDKQAGETPPVFVKRVYGEWLGKGLTRATVRHLDPSLDQAIINWRRNHEWPDDVDLPTKSEQTSRWVDRVKQEGLASLIPEGSPQEVLRAARRLTMAKHRRNQKHEK